MCHDNSTLAVFITTYGVSKVLFGHQTIVDSALLTKLRSSTKQGDTHNGPRPNTAVLKSLGMEDIIYLTGVLNAFLEHFRKFATIKFFSPK